MTQTRETENMTETVKYGEGYAVVTTDKGEAMVLVRKREVGNPSARGGAYMTEWVATARGQKFRATTRKAAVAAAVVSLRQRGFSL